MGVLPLFLIGVQLATGHSFLAALRTNVAWIVGSPIVWLVGIPLAQRWGAARTFRATPAARGERIFTVDEDAITIDGGLSSGTLTWPAIVRVVETRDLFLLFLSKQMAHFVPKSGFASAGDIDRFRVLMTTKVSQVSGRAAQGRGAAT